MIARYYLSTHEYPYKIGKLRTILDLLDEPHRGEVRLWAETAKVGEVYKSIETREEESHHNGDITIEPVVTVERKADKCECA